MKATLRHIYLCMTAYMSWRTCVLVKQIQSNQPTNTVAILEVAACLDISPPLMNLTALEHLCSNFERFNNKYLNTDLPTKRCGHRKKNSYVTVVKKGEFTVGAGEGSSKAATLKETCALVHIDESLFVRWLVTEGADSPAVMQGEGDTWLAVVKEHDLVLLLYVMFTFRTRIFYRGVPGFATDCPCGVWYRGLTTCPLYVGPIFRNLV